MNPTAHLSAQPGRERLIDRRGFLGAAAASGLTLACAPTWAWAQGRQRRPNVLFIAVDDLRPQLGCYGHPMIQSPHIDRLAGRGTVFERAYCNYPMCGPSRASVLTGLRVGPRPWSTAGVGRPFVSLPAHFKTNGYHAISNGKVFHHMRDRQEDWSEPPWRSVAIYHGKGDWAGYNTYGVWQNPESGESVNPKTGRGPYCEAADVPDNAYQDGKVADKTIADLKRLKSQDKPFFMAAGFWRPHLPFNAPRKYWDLYDRDAIDPAPNRFRPKNAPEQLQSTHEIDRYGRTGDRKVTDAFHREARHAYFACISYVDAQVGRVLQTLRDLDMADNTIVVLWGDHGWNLGEHTFWGKHNTLNTSLHSPLIVCPPQGQSGNRTGALVELVDIYPSLCELAGLSIPGHVEGTSVGPLLSRPDRPWKPAVFAEVEHCQAVKTDRYLYSQWTRDDKVEARMLFDHQTDPRENVNIAGDPDAAPIIERLSGVLHKGWRAAVPSVGEAPGASL